MDISTIIHAVLSLDESILSLVNNYGYLAYLILFTIIFLETGVVLAPFLPGDSLLFAAGAVAAIGGFNIFLILIVLFAAAVLGDSLNYFIGKTWGRGIVDYARRKNFIINYKHIAAAEKFYSRHGSNAIFLARFIPIVRTFAPLVAGIARMDYSKFIFSNVTGAVVWILVFVLGGFWFGNIPLVKENFTIVILVIVAISLVPLVIHTIKERKN